MFDAHLNFPHIARMFKRREKPKIALRIKQLVWPKMHWKRIARYLKLRIVRLSHTPEPLARGIACGVTVSFFPVFGIHALMGIAMAIAMRANVLAAALATIIIPPVILPLLFSLDFLVGRKILHYLGVHGQGSESDYVQKVMATDHNTIIRHFDEMMLHFQEFFFPAFIGAAIFMLLVWPAAYMAAHKLIEALVAHHDKHKKQKAEA